MCKHGDTVILNVPIPATASHTGEFRWALKPIDRCIAHYVKALNDAGIFTGGSCCGHGKGNGVIGFHNGTRFTIDHVDLADRSCVGEAAMEANNA